GSSVSTASGHPCGARFRVRATNSRHDLPVAPDLPEQAFVVTRPNQVWLAGIPSVPTAEGWLYLAVTWDLFTRKIAGKGDARSPARRTRHRCLVHGHPAATSRAQPDPSLRSRQPICRRR
ncbi:MAG: hypothetical protein WBZ54_00345, partial [Methylocella sp.]